jgi:predicted PurR-regulated permease PerM
MGYGALPYLNPVIILLSLTFWGWMWGIVGIIFSCPDPGRLQDFLRSHQTDGAASRVS